LKPILGKYLILLITVGFTMTKIRNNLWVFLFAMDSVPFVENNNNNNNNRQMECGEFHHWTYYGHFMKKLMHCYETPLS
jgi:hypothetical protein